MKGKILLIVLTCISSFAMAQSLGVGTGAPNSKAALHVESPTNNQGFIMPRLTTAQRTAMSALLAAGDIGLMLFDTDLKSIQIWDGTKWVKSASSVLPLSSTLSNSDMLNDIDALNITYTGDSSRTLLNLNFANAANTQVSNPFRLTHAGQGAAFVLTQSSILGTGAIFTLSNPSNPQQVFRALNQGLGQAGNFRIANSSNSSVALYTETTGSGPALNAVNQGTTDGFAGLFSINQASNSFPAIQASSKGSGSSFRSFQNPGEGIGNGVDVFMNNPTSSGTGVLVDHTGLGSAGSFNINNVSSSASALYAATNGSGYALEVRATGTGETALFDVNNPTSSGSPIVAQTNGTGLAGYFLVNNTANGGTALQAITNSNLGGATPPVAVLGTSTGTGASAGAFRINNGSNPYAALFSQTNGTGMSLLVNHAGPSGNIAIFQNNSANVARIDKTGQGFFNGGTQNSGADIAELFDVEGILAEYEPGDVLVISQSTDRTVEKSSTPNSTLIAGVYATKPGLRLTEREVTESVDDLVPMGVVGVIPTKVCLENGPIKRGDLLVTSSVKGHAMKAKPVVVNGIEIYPTGAILGKALENFDGNEKGLIKVLVNVK